VLVWVAWRWRVGFLLTTVTLIALSFAMNVYLFQSDQTADFYSPLTRFWELSAGSTLAYSTMISQRNLGPEGADFRNAQSLIGALLVCAGLLTVTQKSYFPGFWAVLPVVGTWLIIGAGTDAIVNRLVLSHPFFVWFGLISFPLYLWHWPLLSFVRIIDSGIANPLVRISVVGLAVGLAWLTYSLVERPLRFGRYKVAKVSGLIIAMMAVGAVGFATFKRDGLVERTVVEINLDPGDMGGDLGFLRNGCGVTGEASALLTLCASDSREEPRFALLGDSKALALWGGLVRTSRIDGRWLIIGGHNSYGAPVPLISNAPPYQNFQGFIVPAIRALQDNKHIDEVAIVAAARAIFKLGDGPRSLRYLQSTSLFHAALDGLTNTVGALVASGKSVVLVVDNPTLLNPEDCMMRKTSLAWPNVLTRRDLPADCRISVVDHLALTARYRELLDAVASQFSGRVRIFDTIPVLCEGGECLPFKNGRMLYHFTDHVSDYAAGLIGEQLNGFMARRP
jgi:hypothetical protein